MHMHTHTYIPVPERGPSFVIRHVFVVSLEQQRLQLPEIPVPT